MYVPGRLIGAMRADGVIGGNVKVDPMLGEDIPDNENVMHNVYML